MTGRNAVEDGGDEALREVQELYRSVIENTSAIILRVDPCSVITFANRRALDFFGYSAEELIGKHAVGTIVPPRETTGRDLAQLFDAITRNPNNYRCNANENICKDGRRVWVEWTNSGIYDESGKLKEFVSVGIDATERMRAEENEQRLLALMDHNPSLVFLKDECGRYVYLNESYREQFARTQDWLGKTDYDFWNEESAALFRANDTEVLRSGETQQFLEDSTDKTGKRYCWLCYKFPFTDSKGAKFVGGIGIDATDRVLAEEALRKSEEKYRTLFTSIDEGYLLAEVTFDENDRPVDILYLEANPAATRLAGRDFVGRRMREIAPNYEPYWFEIYGSVALTGEPVRAEHFAAPHGRWFEFFAFKAGGQESRRVATIFQDITERKRSGEALRRSELRYRTLVNATSAVTWSCPPSGFHVEPQPEWMAFTGQSAEEMLGNGWTKAIHPEDLPGVAMKWQEAVDRGEPYANETRIRSHDGEWRWMNVRIAPVREVSGEIVEWFGMHIDITDRKQIALQLAASVEDLRHAQQELVRNERMATLGKLAGSVAHEMRTPLTVIRNGMFFLAQCYPAEDREVRESLEEVKRAVISCDQIITEMLDYVREPVPCHSVFAVGDAISQALNLVPPPATIHVQVPPLHGSGEMMVQANQQQVTRILVNLIQNAVQAMAGGGELAIGVNPEEPNRICVSVRDTGCGISVENLDKIFDPLFSTKTTGIGLGLSIAKRYAELNGGELSVESELGCGTTFRLSLRSADEQ